VPSTVGLVVKKGLNEMSEKYAAIARERFAGRRE